MRLSLGFSLSAFTFLLATEAVASLDNSANPVVTLPYGSFQGKVLGVTTQFLGMPYAAPPYVFRRSYPPLELIFCGTSTDQRRFGLPEPPLPFTGVRNATAFGAPCSQQVWRIPPHFPVTFPSLPNASEDCMTNNFSDLYSTTHEIYRSFHQCCTPHEYFSRSTAPGPLRKSINILSGLFSNLLFSTSMEVRL